MLMKESYRVQLAELATTLVTPERYGRIAVLPNLDYLPGISAAPEQFPELAKMYEFPVAAMPEDIGA